MTIPANVSVAAERVPTARDQDLFAYNVVSVSRADLQRIKQLLRATFREIRTIVASSTPEEVAALVNLQLVAFLPAGTAPSAVAAGTKGALGAQEGR